MFVFQNKEPNLLLFEEIGLCTLESVIDVGQGISVGPGRFGKKNKRRALKIWKKE